MQGENGLGEGSTRAWRTDFKETVDSLMAGQDEEGSWGGSWIQTIRRLFHLHLTVRERNQDIERALNRLMDGAAGAFPAKRIALGGKLDAAALRGLPFSRGCTGYFLYSASLFLSTIFQRENNERVLEMYGVLDSLGVSNQGLWCGRACSSNMLRGPLWCILDTRGAAPRPWRCRRSVPFRKSRENGGAPCLSTRP